MGRGTIRFLRVNLLILHADIVKLGRAPKLGCCRALLMRFGTTGLGSARPWTAPQLFSCEWPNKDTANFHCLINAYRRSGIGSWAVVSFQRLFASPTPKIHVTHFRDDTLAMAALNAASVFIIIFMAVWLSLLYSCFLSFPRF